MTELRLGTRTVSLADAAKLVVRYTTSTDPKHPYSYPFYDRLATSAEGLVEADFLAPLLLNAAPTLAGYASLCEVRDDLAAALGAIPLDADLAHADDDEIEALRALFAPLDRGLFGISGTILSKVLHRKRPAFIPLYDEHVRRCFQDGAGAPVPSNPDRAWSEFMVQLARAIRSDLTTTPEAWSALAEIPSQPRLSTLRCLDILAWELGKTPWTRN